MKTSATFSIYEVFDGENTFYQYGTSSSNTTIPTSWSTTVPTPQAGRFIWRREGKALVIEDVTWSTPVCLTGTKGDPGQDGNDGISISSVIEEYYKSTSATALSGGTWSTTVPTWEQGKYIWTRSKITFSNNTTSYTSAMNSTGAKGNTGAPGAAGPQGEQSIGLGYKLNKTGLTASNNGEIYFHGFNNGVAASVDGWIYNEGEKILITQGYINPGVIYNVFPYQGYLAVKLASKDRVVAIRFDAVTKTFIFCDEGHSGTVVEADWCIIGTFEMTNSELVNFANLYSEGKSLKFIKEEELLKNGQLVLSWSGQTISIKSLNNQGFISYNSDRVYLDAISKTFTKSGNGVIIANLNTREIRFCRLALGTTTYNSQTIDTIEFIDFNTDNLITTKHATLTNWAYIKIGQFKINSDLSVATAILDSVESLNSYLMKSFMDILKDQSIEQINSEIFDRWLKAFDIDNYYKLLAVSSLFVNKLLANSAFIQDLFSNDIVVNNRIRSSNFEEGVAGFNLDKDGVLRAINSVINKGTFIDADLSGKFTSNSLETFDAKPDIDSSWGLSQNIVGKPKSLEVASSATSSLYSNQRSVVYGNGVWIILSMYGKYNISTDHGISWTLKDPPSSLGSDSEFDIKFVNNLFIGTSAYDKEMYKSSDGINWTTISTIYIAPRLHRKCHDIVYFNGYYYFSTAGEDLHKADLNSAGSTQVKYFSNNIDAITVFKNKIYVALYRKIYSSSDGLNWTELITLSSPIYSFSVKNNEEIFCCGHNGFVAKSTDGINWISNRISTSTFTFCMYYKGLWVVAGDDGALYSIDSTEFNQSTISYTRYATPYTYDFKNFAFDNTTDLGIFIYPNHILRSQVLLYNISPITKYLLSLQNELIPPTGKNLPDSEPLLFFMKVSGTITVNGVTHNLSKLKITDSSIIYYDTNNTKYTVLASDRLISNIEINNLYIYGELEENHMSAIAPKKGNDTGYIGKDGNRFLEARIKNVYSDQVHAVEVHGKVYAS